MFKNVVALGDSFMAGSELEYGKAIPYLLATHWNCELYNLAQPGAGILNVIEQVKLAESNGTLTNDSFIIFSLPPAGRIDLPYVNNNNIILDYWFHKNAMEGKFDQPLRAINIDSNPNFLKFREIYQALGKDCDLLLFGEQIHYSGVAGFLGLLSKYPNQVGIIGHPQHCMDNYYNQKLYELLHLHNMLLIEQGFTGYAKKNKFSIMPGGHPGADAHYALFKLIRDGAH